MVEMVGPTTNRNTRCNMQHLVMDNKCKGQPRQGDANDFLCFLLGCSFLFLFYYIPVCMGHSLDRPGERQRLDARPDDSSGVFFFLAALPFVSPITYSYVLSS